MIKNAEKHEKLSEEKKEQKKANTLATIKRMQAKLANGEFGVRPD